MAGKAAKKKKGAAAKKGTANKKKQGTQGRQAIIMTGGNLQSPTRNVTRNTTSTLGTTGNTTRTAGGKPPALKPVKMPKPREPAIKSVGPSPVTGGTPNVHK